MKKLFVAVIGLAAFCLASVQCTADEKAAGAAGVPMYAKLKPNVVPIPVGPLDQPAKAVQKPDQPAARQAKPTAYPVKLALGQPPLPRGAAASQLPTKEIRFGLKPSVFDLASEQFTDVITVFGERVVPPPERSGLEHVASPSAKYASDEYQWTFWQQKNATGKPLFGTDFVFRYRYPTEGAAPRDFRGGEVIVGFAINVPLSTFRPVGLLFTR